MEYDGTREKKTTVYSITVAYIKYPIAPRKFRAILKLFMRNMSLHASWCSSLVGPSPHNRLPGQWACVMMVNSWTCFVETSMRY